MAESTQSSPRFASTANPFGSLGPTTKLDPIVAAALAKRTPVTTKQEAKNPATAPQYKPSAWQIQYAQARAGGNLKITLPTTVAASNSSVLDAYNYSKNTTNTKPPASTNNTNNGGGTKIPVPSNPFEYKWNLPPHKWSLPLDPAVVNNPSRDSNSSLSPATELGKRGQTNDAYRRGRIWWRATDSFSIATSTDTVGKPVTNDKASKLYGFQFLWNPESFGTSVDVQMDVTPHSNDRLGAVVGAFPSTQNISFTVRIDRTNDFACAARDFGRPALYGASAASFRQADQASVTRYYATEAAKNQVPMYRLASSFHQSSSDDVIVKKIVDLMDRGTIADLEYLYRTINGAGPSGDTRWRNPRDIETADIGFLMPTLVNVDIGPLSYIGYVTNLRVNHLAFTQDMVPIRTDVSISLNLLATAGISSKISSQG